MTSRLDEAIADLWAELGDRSSLMSDLALDAVLARADSGEMAPCAPRLVELCVADDTAPVSVPEVLARLQPLLAGGARNTVLSALDAWWQSTLYFEDSKPSAGRVLGALAQLDEPMVRWLNPWLSALDGPGAKALAAMILGDVSEDGWDAVPDKRTQVLAWAASEPVVFGLTFVGGVYLAEGELSDVLDRLI